MELLEGGQDCAAASSDTETEAVECMMAKQERRAKSGMTSKRWWIRVKALKRLQLPRNHCNLDTLLAAI